MSVGSTEDEYVITFWALSLAVCLTQVICHK
jgi:hypothetical protein